MIRRVQSVVIASAILIFAGQSVGACSCGNATADQAFAASDVTFIGKVLKIRNVKEAGVGVVMKESGTLEIRERGRWEKSFDNTQRVLLEIVDGLKGTVRGTVELTTAAYNGGGSCGVRFRVGETYLVYARRRVKELRAWQQPGVFSNQVKEDWAIVERLCTEADKFNETLPTLTTSVCMRTVHMKWAQQDLETIRASKFM